MNIFLNKKGDSALFQILICITILTFLLFFPVVSFSYFKFQTSVDDIALTTMRTATVRGGVDEEVMKTLVEEFQAKGYSFEGAMLNGKNSAKIVVWTNTNLCKDGVYTITNDNGTTYSITIREWPNTPEEKAASSNPEEYFNTNLRRYRTGFTSYKEGNSIKTVENGSEIKIRITVPISAHSTTLNALYGLLSGGSKDPLFENEGYGYSVSLTNLSELYQESQIVID